MDIPLVYPKPLEKSIPMYSAVIAYQNTCVPPSIMSAHFAPTFPRVYRKSKTDVSPVLAPMAHIDATYTPSIRLPTRIIHKRLSKLKAAPKDAPEAIVGVKKVNPMRTALIGRSPFLAVAGT